MLVGLQANSRLSVGVLVGLFDGFNDGDVVGYTEGILVGFLDGFNVKIVGDIDGLFVGEIEGIIVYFVCDMDGVIVGIFVGVLLGLLDGIFVGDIVGCSVGIDTVGYPKYVRDFKPPNYMNNIVINKSIMECNVADKNVPYSKPFKSTPPRDYNIRNEPVDVINYFYNDIAADDANSIGEFYTINNDANDEPINVVASGYVDHHVVFEDPADDIDMSDISKQHIQRFESANGRRHVKKCREEK
eukprot:630364_1